MKKYLLIFIAGVMLIGSSCKKYLDINDNPNSATAVTPRLVLPQALTYTAGLLNSFNSYGSQTGMYAANAGGYGGFGESITYNYTGTGTGMFNSSFDLLEDYQYIINSTEGDVASSYLTAVARIMKAYHFQLLVDTYGDVPYTQALQGSQYLTPAYTPAEEIYPDLVDQLDVAIADINKAQNTLDIAALGTADVLFHGDMDLWKKFASTVKLRIIIRGQGKVTFSNTNFPEGFLTTDAIVNPGYLRDNGRTNPQWGSWAYNGAGTTGNRAWMPSSFIFGFYNGTTLQDSVRGKATYYQFPSTGTNRLGVESNAIPSSPTGSFWYPSSNRDGLSAGGATGVLKGPSTGYPILLAAESYFLQAEAALKGITPSGDVKSLFDDGMTASFAYTLTNESGVLTADPAAAVAEYKATNGSFLVNIAAAASNEQRLQAIITQKFLANNFIRGEESFNEYRRTGYPAVNPSGNGFETFASSVSESPRADKLPTRVLYPTSEAANNSANVPIGISPFTTLIFWAK